MGRRIGLGLAIAVAALVALAIAAPTGGASSTHGRACSVTNAGGSPSSVALGGWGYDVNFSCPFKISSFSIKTNKHLRSGTDVAGNQVPWANSQLSDGQQVNFTCKSSGAKSFKCTLNPALPARLPITDGFDSHAKCTNTDKGDLQFTLSANGRRTRVSFNGKTTNGRPLTGGCG